jgi:2'-5' RNA ligase
VGAFEGELKRSGADVKWVEPANLHLTLKFLGNIAEEQVPSLISSLQQACGGLSAFTFSLEGIGAFPRTTSPRVIWVGVHEGKEALAGLAQRVEETCAALGFPAEERPFSAHLTIGRTRSPQGIARLIKQLQVAEFRGKTQAEAGQIVLFQSALSPHGPTYIPLAEIPFSAPGT